MKKRMQYSFLVEQTTICAPHEIKILEESKTESGHSRLTFQARLQEANTLNNNKRIYNTAVCESIVGQLGPKAQNRSMLMEVDHPMFFPGSNDPMQMKKRATITEIKNCGAVCRNISFKNGQVLGEIETLSGLIKEPLYTAMYIE